MKKHVALFLCLMGILSLTACSAKTKPAANQEAPQIELVVFAAASLQKVLTDIARAYRDTAPSTTLTFTFDSSGTLKTQIAEGAPCDIFISAGQTQMNALDAAQGTEGLDFVLAGTRFDLLENEVVLVVPAGNPAGISSFDDLSTDRLNLIAIGNSDVPVGQYAAEILTNLGMYAALEAAGKLTFGSNTTEVAMQIAEDAVDCGIIYKTDVASAVDPEALQIVASAPGGSVSRALYPAAVLNSSRHADEARVFLAFLKGDIARALFEQYGFTVDFK